MHGRNVNIHAAAESGRPEEVSVLLAKEPGIVNSQGHMMRTPLMCAARWGHVQVIEVRQARGWAFCACEGSLGVDVTSCDAGPDALPHDEYTHPSLAFKPHAM